MSDDVPETERRHAAGAELDRLSTAQLVALLVEEQRTAVDAVLQQSAALAGAVDEIAARLARGGRLHYVGAGTSGRIATLDAAEMPPTFGTPADLVRAHIAGGAQALTSAVEGAEDDAAAGDAIVQQHVRADDALVGISASGGAAFVVHAVRRGRAMGAYTVALVNVAGSELERAAECAIVTATGAELLTGSTRLKAGTAQKIALNTLSTAVMVALGKVHGNLMVDVVAGNRKLRDRAIRLVRELTGIDAARARELLDRANGRVKIAVVMERRGVDAAVAAELLQRQRGVLRELL